MPAKGVDMGLDVKAETRISPAIPAARAARPSVMGGSNGSWIARFPGFRGAIERREGLADKRLSCVGRFDRAQPQA